MKDKDLQIQWLFYAWTWWLTHMHALKMLLLEYQICSDLSDQCYTSRSSCYGFIIQEVSKVCCFVPQPKKYMQERSHIFWSQINLCKTGWALGSILS